MKKILSLISLMVCAIFIAACGNENVIEVTSGYQTESIVPTNATTEITTKKEVTYQDLFNNDYNNYKDCVEIGNYKITDIKKNQYTDEEYQKQVWGKIIENSNIKRYPENELATLKKTIDNNVKAQFEQYGSYYKITTFDEWIKQILEFPDMDSYEKYVEQYAKDYLTEKMIVTCIAKKEGITVTQLEIDEGLLDTAKTYNYNSIDELCKEFGKEGLISEIGYGKLWDKVFNKCISLAN